jgi:tRNA 2-thiouridine synthesizing protein A
MTDRKVADRYLDCKALSCPLPIVRVSQAMKEMLPGQTLLIEAVDPAFQSDLEAWARTTGYEVLDFSEGPVQRALVRKPAPAKEMR